MSNDAERRVLERLRAAVGDHARVYANVAYTAKTRPGGYGPLYPAIIGATADVIAIVPPELSQRFGRVVTSSGATEEVAG